MKTPCLPKNKPSVLVLLAAFNGIQWLPEQVGSILNQVDVDITMMVSIDQSTDGTEAWFAQLALEDSRICILPHGKVFGGAAPNFFRLIGDADFSHFDYASLADQDDIWLPNKLARAIEVLQKENIAAYSSNVIAFWPNGKQALITKSQPQVQWDFLFEAAGPGCTYVFTQSFAIELQKQVQSQADIVNKVGLHDWFIYAFARAHQYQWLIDDQALMLYRQHEANQVGTNKGLKALVHRAKKVLSGWAFEQSRLMAQANKLNESSFVKSWLDGSRVGYIRLGLNAKHCRRRSRDQWIFSLMCFLLALTGGKKR